MFLHFSSFFCSFHFCTKITLFCIFYWFKSIMGLFFVLSPFGGFRYEENPLLLEWIIQARRSLDHCLHESMFASVPLLMDALIWQKLSMSLFTDQRNKPRCNEETRTIKAVPIFVWNFDPISWKNYQIWSNFRQTEN